jgi:hypothetical protein
MINVDGKRPNAMTVSQTTFVCILLGALFLAGSPAVVAQSRVDQLLAAPTSTSDASIIVAAEELKPFKPQPGVDWAHLVGQSFFFLSVENSFRCATEEGTRDAFSNGFFSGYLNSVGNLHGWNDGDPFYVNYVGHPMQGAVSGDIWTHNDRAYRTIEFGANRRYWKGKFRGAAYSYVYSVLFEIGPISEASVGNIQSLYPQQGFVDHIATPVFGLAWSVAEDAVDELVIRRIEEHDSNVFIRALARGGLNPSRTMANVMALQYPWHRDNRPGVRSSELRDLDYMGSLRELNTSSVEVSPPPGVPPFELNMAANVRAYLGEGHGGPCVGGGAAGAIRVSSQWQFVVDVGGCKMLDLEKNLSGDSLTYVTGLRWTPESPNRFTPHGEFLVGGTKLTQELVNPQLEEMLDLAAKEAGDPPPPHSAYSTHWETNALTLQAGSGVDLRLNSALSFRMANLEYSHSWNNRLNGNSYQNALQLTTGLVLQMGTW